ncbi:uncharacterized protein CLUP02_02774 [Colletotrichum lupini]|uniref:Uncharacterized protein n=1 Tax=Colletotrichum lupini TaxID=145971 RepID=A0A9Q8SH57_9PEZI|nr:uncharacterized protein CLUP02_02774 [Colletotrichum lupini]UQC77307.1 hypothetical protein CLUP02_02774 [Colletotrichum lupini]
MLAFCATNPGPPVHPSTGALRRWAALPVPASYFAKTPRFRTPNMPKLMDDGRGLQAYDFPSASLLKHLSKYRFFSDRETALQMIRHTRIDPISSAIDIRTSCENNRQGSVFVPSNPRESHLLKILDTPGTIGLCFSVDPSGVGVGNCSRFSLPRQANYEKPFPTVESCVLSQESSSKRELEGMQFVNMPKPQASLCLRQFQISFTDRSNAKNGLAWPAGYLDFCHQTLEPRRRESPALLAQSVERETLNLKVAGSTPASWLWNGQVEAWKNNAVKALAGNFPPCDTFSSPRHIGSKGLAIFRLPPSPSWSSRTMAGGLKKPRHLSAFNMDEDGKAMPKIEILNLPSEVLLEIYQHLAAPMQDASSEHLYWYYFSIYSSGVMQRPKLAEVLAAMHSMAGHELCSCYYDMLPAAVFPDLCLLLDIRVPERFFRHHPLPGGRMNSLDEEWTTNAANRLVVFLN